MTMTERKERNGYRCLCGIERRSKRCTESTSEPYHEGTKNGYYSCIKEGLLTNTPGPDGLFFNLELKRLTRTLKLKNLKTVEKNKEGIPRPKPLSLTHASLPQVNNAKFEQASL
ncbi:hypothetical protein, unlikely [Trypanosoma brucei brucei TREU927]|uniref:Uncharacterized protein n=1 Tax=Trypanosoma brucei brucei (strain 927/4 GUTat10.1) TaxID=185431 RepID=Q38FN5_TRYB2|nr:hypothetical protein, unlikely [Trypanosoma brucei brucei TREU927]EAN76385.1 hypothetical protein, unlikely [Trypanosoma brucei brucei TREU927]